MAVLRNIIHFIVIVAFAAGLCFSLIIQGGFNYNQSFIVKELCVNKDQPQLQCNGKCYLKKQMEQNVPENQEKEATQEGL